MVGAALGPITDSEEYTSRCVVVVQIEDGGMDVRTKLGQQPCLLVPGRSFRFTWVYKALMLEVALDLMDKNM